MSKIYLILVGVFLCASLSKAQTVEIADTLELESITVTASKIPILLRETTKPVIIIDNAAIADRSGTSISQLLDEQSGINVNGANSNPGLNKSLFMQGAASKYTLFLIDGLAVQDPNGLGGASDLRNISLDNVERIEIVKGSSSTLYGTDAIAGVVNIITKKPKKKVQLNGTLSYGSFNSYKTAIGANSSLKGGSYSINFSHEGTHGITEAEDNSGAGNFDEDGFERNSLNAQATVEPIKGLSVTPFLAFSGFDGDYDMGAFADGSNKYESRFFNPGIQATYQLGALNWNTGYNYSGSDYSFNAEFFTAEYEGQLQNFDTYTSYDILPSLKALAGFNYQNLKIGGSSNTIENPNSKIYSPYFTTILTDWNNVSAEAGIRLNSHSEFGNNVTFSISGSYNILDIIKAIASFGTGFRAPSLLELFGPFGANPNLDPESSLYLNIGFESYLMEKQLKIGVNYFDRSIEDLIVYTTGYVNQNEQNDSGIEASFNYFINPLLTVTGNYDYLTGELISLDFEGNKTTTDYLIRRPKHNFRMGAIIHPIPELTLSLNGRYLGERTDLFFDPVTFASSEVTLNSYLLINLYANYQIMDGLITIFADVKNLANTDYTEVYGYSTPGLNGTVGLKLNFK